MSVLDGACHIMNDKHNEKYKSKKSCIGVVLSVLVILLGVGAMLWYYAPHLLWKYAEWRYGLHEIERIVTGQMPEVGVPDDWMEHSFDNMRLSLPPDMTLVTQEGGYKENMSFRVVSIPYPDLDAFLRIAPLLHPEQNSFSTLTQLRFESLTVDAGDFHWSMSRQEARWHSYVIGTIRLMYPSNFGTHSVEIFSGKNWDGLLLLRKKIDINKCQFDWHCMYCSNGGFIVFSTFGESTKLDLDVVRAIVRSIEVDCPCQQNDHAQGIGVFE